MDPPLKKMELEPGSIFNVAYGTITPLNLELMNTLNVDPFEKTCHLHVFNSGIGVIGI